MRTVPRTRHYLAPGALTLCRPLLSFDYVREAYVLRAIGDRIGPVVREDRRRGRSSSKAYDGPERRGMARSRQPHVTVAPAARATPTGQGRSKTAGQARPATPGQTGPAVADQTRPPAAGQTRPATAGQTRSKASRRPRSKNARG